MVVRSDGEVDCMACDMEFVAATPKRVLKRLSEFESDGSIDCRDYPV